MPPTLSLIRAFVFLFLLTCFASAQAAKPAPLENFAPQRSYDTPLLSSDGTFIAVGIDLGDNEHGIVVFRLSDMSTTAFIQLKKYELAAAIHWVSDRRLIYVKGGQWGSREQPYNFGEIIGMDFDGKNHSYIFGYKESTLGVGIPAGFGTVAGLPPVPNGKFYMRRDSPEHSLPATLVYEVDAGNGRSRLVADIGARDLTQYCSLSKNLITIRHHCIGAMNGAKQGGTGQRRKVG